MVVTIDVTGEDILAGCRYVSDNCPVARAVQRHVRSDILVSIYDIACFQRLRKDGKPDRHYRNVTVECPAYPPKAYLWVKAFDAGALVEPFTFDLDIPDEFIKE